MIKPGDPVKPMLAWLCVFAACLSVLGYIAQVPAVTVPSQLAETRYAEQVVRDAAGKIRRSTAVTRAYAESHWCPDNGLPDAGCPGWAIQCRAVHV